jgi:hypothetical protein
MKLYERFGAKGFHTSLISTFGIDFDTYENVCLNRLRGAGCTNNFILPDARMLSLALDGASALPRHAGRLYAAASMGASRKGVFHSKLFLRLGRRGGELLAGSANMTAPGLAGNRELMGMIECGVDESGERRIVAAAWAYLEARLDQTQTSIAQQVAWMLKRTPWLKEAEPATGLTALRDGSVAAFLTNDAETGIGRRFIDFIEGRPVERLIVISPYWDQKLAGLKQLIAQLTPRETVLMIEPDRQLFPADALQDVSNVALRDISALDDKRFFHAKAIIAQTREVDHVLFGSANCTVAALGSGLSRGINDEACLYRRLPTNASIGALGIERLLTTEHEIKVDQIELPQPTDDLDLAEIARRDPGRFECVYDILTWWPPVSAKDVGAIELLDADGKQCPVILTDITPESSAMRRFRLSGTDERPALARLRYIDGTASAPAIVALADILRQRAKESRSKKAEAVAARLSEETDEGFWLLEALDILQAAEERQTGGDAKTVTRKRRPAGKPEQPEKDHRTLAYDRFIAGRRLRSDDSKLTPNSFGGSDLALVRGFINRILGIGGHDEIPPDAEDNDGARAFDMGDETGDAESAIERGDEFAKPTPKKPDEEEEEKKKKEREKARREAHRDDIIAKVTAFDELIHKHASAGKLGAVDILKLRALIIVVAVTGWSGAGNNGAGQQTAMQAFPAAGDANSWPRLMGRVLFAFFGGSHPAIHELRLDASFDDLTADIVEGWATCFWAIQACLDGARKHKDNVGLVKPLETLAQRLYAVTRLQEVEMTGPGVMGVIKAMNERYAARLGIDAGAVERTHLNESAKLRPVGLSTQVEPAH